MHGSSALMRGKLLAPSRAIVCACALLGALAGCTPAPSSGAKITGKTLTIYASAPSRAAGGAQAQDVLDAETLALTQAGSQVGSFKVVLKPLVLSAEPTSAQTIAQLTANARKALLDSSTIAYLGELVPHSSYASIGITSAQDVLQVSPTDTALELTQRTAAVPGAPNRYYQALKTSGFTFARVVPTSALEAKAQAQEMKALGVKQLYVADDGGPYGRAVALAVRQDVPSSIRVLTGPATAAKFRASKSDAMFYGVSADSEGARVFNALAGPKVKLFGPSTLADQTFASALMPSARRGVYISSPGFLTATELPAAGQKFLSDFAAAYHRPPASYAIFGYEAMSAVLAVLRQADTSTSTITRSTVVHDFLAIKDRPSVLGTYTIKGGDTTLGSFVFSHFNLNPKSGTLTPFKFVPVTG
ncbi:MAG: hypothetical protein ACR2IP_00240 [Solirubrobacteraceae bacterium]